MSTADTVSELEQASPSSVARSAVDERRATAWIGQGVVIEGRITSLQDLRIDGKVDGSIEVGSHGLIIGAGATVKADLLARSIVVSGAVIGNVTATDRVDLHATGSIAGSVRSPRLVMFDGAVISGKVDAGRNRAEKGKGERADL